MKNKVITYMVLVVSLFSIPALSQTENQADEEDTLLGLPGDNLDLFAVLDLFQKSKTIEDFEKSLNLEETGINNLDLDLDGNVDFIKVVTEQDGNDFAFVLQVDVSEEETQDVAVILVSKDDDQKISMQVVGDKDLYGKDYVIEPAPPAPAVTANPAYTGNDPVESTPAITQTIVVESTPIVQYVYSPAYVPYYPPYTYAYPPPYFRAIAVVSIGIYRHNHYYHYPGYHGGYRGGYHGNTVVVHNHNTYNNYNRTRNSSNTVNQNNANRNYDRSGASASTRPSSGASASTRPSTASSANQSRSSPSASQSRSSRSTSQSRPSPSTSQSRPSSSPSYSSRPSSSGGASRSMSTSPSSRSMSGGMGRRR